MNIEQMVGVTEAAKVLPLSSESIRRRLRAGVIQGEKAAGQVWLISQEEIKRLKASTRANKA